MYCNAALTASDIYCTCELSMWMHGISCICGYSALGLRKYTVQ